VIDALIAVVNANQLLSNQASMIFSTQKICISRRHALQINNITPFVGSPYSLNLHTPRNFNRFARSIKYFVDLNTQFARNFLH